MRAISLTDARRLAVMGALLSEPRPTDLVDTVRWLGGLQVDPVAVVARAEQMVLWSQPPYAGRAGHGGVPVPVLKFLHIVSMFAAVTTLFATQLMLVEAVRRKDARAIHGIARHGHLIENVGVGLFFLGIALGLLTALTGSFNLLAPWLLIAYLLVVVILITGAVVESPIMARLAKAARGERRRPAVRRARPADEPLAPGTPHRRLSRALRGGNLRDGLQAVELSTPRNADRAACIPHSP